MFKDLVLFKDECRFKDELGIDSLIYTSVIEKLNEIKGAKFPVIFKGDILQNRKLIENRRINILVDLELNNYKDNLNFRNSGLNQVLCRLASKNNVYVAFNFNSILKASSFNRTRILGRMIQNVILCRKYKVKMILTSLATNEYELRSRDALKSFGLVIGMNPREAKDAVEAISKF